MVFANLQEREKDAFFSLLDEYFQSRPEIFAALSKGQGDNHNVKSAPGQSHAFSSAQASDLASKFAGSTAAAAGYAKRGLGGASSHTTTSDPAHEKSEESSQLVAGRVAAAAMAFSQQRRTATPGGSVSSTNAFSSPNKLSEVNTSSIKNAWANRASQPPTTSSHAPPPPVARRGPPQPEPESEEETAHGEWAEALYDYQPTESGDLQIREGQRILVTERTSDDWWTGEVDGKSGIFPASYAKLL
ncbi:hypothetical protein AX17_004967 [Amanita inopinata Kibby_2008]|nr:hypothetical protein AX17_004967 [Amanita inopinata Kibby_2008]